MTNFIFAEETHWILGDQHGTFWFSKHEKSPTHKKACQVTKDKLKSTTQICRHEIGPAKACSYYGMVRVTRNCALCTSYQR